MPMDIRAELASLKKPEPASSSSSAEPKPEEKKEGEEEELPPLGEWEAEANETVGFKLVWDKSEIESKKPFFPLFTHQIFENQRIKGYKGLKVDFFFGAGSLYPYINLSYSEKVEQKKSAKGKKPAGSEGDEITPVIRILCEKLSPNFQPTSNLDTFVQQIEEKESKFKPVGEKVHSYKLTPKPKFAAEDRADSEFEIYAGEIMDPQIAAYHEKLQHFVLFFIDSASYIESDPDWRSRFEKRATSEGNTQYGIVGYCTAHLFYHYPDSKRLRISQFIILPPYQRRGHGMHLLESIYKYAAPLNIADITVEDPSIEFCYLKDTFDLELITKNGYLKKPLSDKSEYTEIQKKLKVNKIQIRKCHEIYTLMKLDKTNEEAKKAYRLAVKARLNKKYLDMLLGATIEERHRALAELYTEAENDYWQVIAHFPVPS